MKRRIHRLLMGAALIGAVLALQTTGEGMGKVCPAYAAELFSDGSGSEADVEIMEPVETPIPTMEPLPTETPVPAETPTPTETPAETPVPTVTPGLSLNIENLNVYTGNGQEGTEEDGLFSDGTQWPKGEALEPSDGGDGAELSGGGAVGGYAGGDTGVGSEMKEEIIRQPRLLLESFSLSDKTLTAGEETETEMVFQNKSVGQSLYNLKVSLSTESPYLQFDRRSFYVSGLAPGGQVTLNPRMGIAMDAKDGPILVSIAFEYEDVKGTAVTGTETVEIRVMQPTAAELECEEFPARVYSTDTIALPVKVRNVSRTGIYNVCVVLEGAGLFPREDIFMGNMEAGTQAEGSMRIYVGTRTMKAIGQDEGTQESEMYGETTGTVTLTYEDGMGNVHKEVKEYAATICKPEVQTLKVEKPKEANSWWISVAAAAAAGMAVLILLLAGRLRRQRMLLEEARREASGERR